MLEFGREAMSSIREIYSGQQILEGISVDLQYSVCLRTPPLSQKRKISEFVSSSFQGSPFMNP
jgi:hypothetical protein